MLAISRGRVRLSQLSWCAETNHSSGSYFFIFSIEFTLSQNATDFLGNFKKGEGEGTVRLVTLLLGVCVRCIL